jgi:hypothetical protein
VSEVLTAQDPMGIGNPPVDEYDSEAGQIARLTLAGAADRAEVERIVQRVFDEYFWPGSAARLDVVAEQVWAAYGWVRELREIKEPSRRNLGPEAIGWAIERLWLARGLEAPLTERLRTGAWQAWTWADPVPDARLAQFGTGGHVFTGGTIAEQVGRLVAHRARRTGGSWMVPDPMAKPSDGFLRDVDHVVVGDAVYYKAAPEPAAIAEAWGKAASAAGQLGMLTTRGFDADSLVFLAIEAYDGDGVIDVEPQSSVLRALNR